MINLLIDGKEVSVTEGTTVLNAARQSGIEIPTLCDHPNLEPYGGCRLCLVEIEGARTLQPSCTLPVTEKMVVHTATEKVIDARKFVLSMIFSERNHFCMYCQVSGGDCELQNAAYDEGMTNWPIQPNWKQYTVDASHPFIVLDHNRCILCRRCVRACGELVGNYTLGMEERGAKTILVADLGIPLGSSSCVSCGTCVQICPTGALIDRQSAYLGHDKDVQKVTTVCPECSVGCTVEVSTRNNQLVRIDGVWEDPRNNGIICEAGRFLPLEDKPQRLYTPLVRKNGELKAATWREALDVINAKFTSLSDANGSRIAAIASQRMSVEALNLFKLLFENHFKSKMVTTFEEDHSTGALSSLTTEINQPFEGNLDDLRKSDFALSIGTDLTKDHQVIGFFVKRISPNQVPVVYVYSEKTGLDNFVDFSATVRKEDYLPFINALRAAVEGKGSELVSFAKQCALEPEFFKSVAAELSTAKDKVFIFGEDLSGKDGKAALTALVDFSRSVEAKIIGTKGKINGVAATQYELNKPLVLDGNEAIYVALADEKPTQTMIQRFEKAPFLVVQSSYISQLSAAADVVLPVETWYEQEGHFITFDGEIRYANRITVPSQDVWSNKKVFETIAASNHFNLVENWEEELSVRPASVKIVAG